MLYGPDEAAARRDALRIWPNGAAPGDLSQELRDPEHFDRLRELVTEEAVAATVPCGPDVEAHASTVKKFADAGFTRINITQLGPGQEEFFAFFERELRPALEEMGIARAPGAVPA